MLPIRTILHPTDFSPQAGKAFELACALARDYGARLIVLHVWVPPPVMYAEGLMPLTPPDNRDELRQRLEDLASLDPQVTLERRFVEGPAIDEIVRLARESRADLIVIGTHGWTGLSRLLMGSVAEGVLRQAPCPVLTVKLPVPNKAPAAEPPAKNGSRPQLART